MQYAFIKTQREEGVHDLEQLFHHNFSKGTLVILEPSRMFDYTATSYNPVFGTPELARRRSNTFNVFAQKVNRSDVVLVPNRFNAVVTKLADVWLRLRYVVGK